MRTSTVVGYQSVETLAPGSDKDFVGPTFAKVSADHDAIKLIEIKPNELFAAFGDVISRINSAGGTLQAFFWVDKDSAEWAEGEYGITCPEGWYDYQALVDGWDMTYTIPNYNNVELNEGEALMLESTEEGSGLLFSGEVDQEDVDLATSAPGSDKCFVANCTPVDIKLGQILPNELFAAFGDVISLMNSAGGTEQAFFYVDADSAAWAEGEYGITCPAGWYDYQALVDGWDMTYTIPCYNNVDIRAGRGMMLESTEEGSGIIIPAAL